MSDNKRIELIARIIDQRVEEFIDTITRKTDIRKIFRSDKSDFPIFHPANAHYFEYKRSEGVLERCIREYLVTDILCSLLMNPEISPNTVVYVSSEQSNIVHPSNYSNESFGEDYPFAFILRIEDRRIGYRYSSLVLKENEKLEDILEYYNIDHIEIIDWSDTDSMESKMIEWGVHPSQREKVFYVTLRKFIDTYFTEEVFNLYVSRVRQAVQSANNIIGFQTIPALSLRYISDFKADFLNRISNESIRSLRYYIFDANGELTGRMETPLQAADYDVLDKRFFEGELYRALVGSEKFAKCFITSEYLYSIFETGDTVSFDYSAVATGYFKSVELLLYKIMKIWLNNPSLHNNLWIKGGTSKYAKDPGKKWCRFNPAPEAKGATQVLFDSHFERRFSTEMGSLIWLLHDNPNGWSVPSGSDIIHRCLFNYSQGCRNEHLHKDIIDSIDVLKPIRQNTILCLYYLLGGCNLTGNLSQDVAELSLEDDTYERLYKRLLNISDSITNFYIQFGEHDPVKAFRIFDQDRPAYDDNGKIISPIRFVLVNDFSDMWFETDEEYCRLVSEKPKLEITRDNLPKRIWWWNSRKGRVEITW